MCWMNYFTLEYFVWELFNSSIHKDIKFDCTSQFGMLFAWSKLSATFNLHIPNKKTKEEVNTLNKMNDLCYWAVQFCMT